MLTTSIMNGFNNCHPLQGIQAWSTQSFKKDFPLFRSQENSTAGLANVLENLKGSLEESNVPDGQDQLYLTKVTRTFSKLSTTSLTFRYFVWYTLIYKYVGWGRDKSYEATIETAVRDGFTIGYLVEFPIAYFNFSYLRNLCWASDPKLNIFTNQTKQWSIRLVQYIFLGASSNRKSSLPIRLPSKTRATIFFKYEQDKFLADPDSRLCNSSRSPVEL